MKKKIKIANIKSTVSVSVTGTVCQLNCKHCGRHYLEKMLPLPRIDELPEGTKSLLISGGSLSDGKVPVLERIGELEKLKEKGYRLNFHVGLVDGREAREIARLADAVSFDFIGDDSTAKKVYNLDATADDYRRSFEHLLAHTEKVYPHITVGLDCGRISHEYGAVEILSRYELEKVVFIVFIPTPGTAFERCAPPDIGKTEEIFGLARKSFGCELNLGCMYPKGKLREEVAMAAVRSGFDLITQPTRRIVEYLESDGYEIEVQDECCVL